MMAQTLNPLLLLLLLILTTFLATPGSAAPIKALLAPITKDTSTSLYTLTLNTNTHFLLDLNGPLVWSPCSYTHPTIPCNSSACSAATSSLPPPCRRRRPKPHHPACTCTATPTNPVTSTCRSADLTLTTLAIPTTNGNNPTAPTTIRGLISSCAPRSLLTSLPAAASGVAGLAQYSALSLPSQLSSSLKLTPQFIICLPSTGSAPGVAFFGGGIPFHLLPPGSRDLTTLLSYTPLVTNPTMKTTSSYYIGLKGIAINREAVRFLARVLEFDSLGRGGARLSTATPYTVLRSHVYRPFVRAFARATRGIPRAPRVAPFGLCLNTSAMGTTRLGYGVPQIDLMLAGGKNWTVFGGNSMKQVGEETACLAFVDGGERAEAAVVVGGFQMEDKVVVFDAGRKRIGFSGTLLGIQTTCQNFNFTRGY